LVVQWIYDYYTILRVNLIGHREVRQFRTPLSSEPDRILKSMGAQRYTKEELARYNGQENTLIFIAHNGKVYDVSSSFLWQNGRHQVVHVAGNDLTSNLSKAPHGTDLLERFPVVGTLVKD
jgi:predicted heme/steroid binding protein